MNCEGTKRGFLIDFDSRPYNMVSTTVLPKEFSGAACDNDVITYASLRAVSAVDDDENKSVAAH